MLSVCANTLPDKFPSWEWEKESDLPLSHQLCVQGILTLLPYHPEFQSSQRHYLLVYQYFLSCNVITFDTVNNV